MEREYSKDSKVELCTISEAEESVDLKLGGGQGVNISSRG